MQTFSTFGDSRRRRRSRVMWRLVRFALVLGSLVLLLVTAYQVGLAQKAAEVARVRSDLDQLREVNERLARREAEAMQQAELASAESAELEARYAAEVPQGDLRRVLDLVREKRGEGVDIDRIAFVLGAITRERDCDAQVVTRRFLVRTPIGGGAAHVVGFGDNRITVTGEGQPARNARGQPEAWFDPALPVELRFTRLGGAVETAQGVLPLTHALVVDGREWRFSARAGEQRGFLELTGQSCAYP